MRRVVMIVGAAWLAASTPVQAGDRDKALEVIQKAIKAHGGADALNRAQIRSRSGEGVFCLGGETRFTTEETVHLPDRCRVVAEPQRARIILVLNGNQGWNQPGGMTQELSKEELKLRKEELYVWWLMNLTPLLKDEFQLKPLPGAKVNGQDASVVQVSHKDFPDVRLFFDNKSGLLVKSARQAKEAGVSVTKEYYYSDHKEFDGIKMPTKEITVLNGSTKFSEVKFNNYKVMSRVEDKLFERP
ncbi:MAG TPA: hypothetical protein VE999_08185 [Gemmataceae bacterium]|nr:hypothetical protein [Gemmataceae bacterium]